MGVLPAWLNPFDALIVLALVAGAAWGFIRGLIRVTLSLIVLYVASILAVAFYRAFGHFIDNIFGMPTALNEAIAFVLILVTAVIIANLILNRTYKDTALPGVRQIDQLGGLVVGFLVAAVWIGLAIVVIAFLLGARLGGASAWQENMLLYFRSSNLIPVFYDFLSVVFSLLRPWMPRGELPEILTFELF
ncbi:MAG: CvpA family protein [Anaerolineae bacterium]|jgi:uncharacterized membrane protein required for colicin V production